MPTVLLAVIFCLHHLVQTSLIVELYYPHIYDLQFAIIIR